MATVILEPTAECNSRCVYCDGVREGKRSSARMPMELLEVLFSRINEFLLARPDENMEVVWHGGEPLLLGPKYFRDALRLQEKHCAQTRTRIRHCIQSNLTLLTREFLGPLKELGITGFGSSYEMVPDVRGLGPRRDSADYNRRFLDAVCLLEEEGFTWGVIYVVTKLSLARPLEIFQHLANLSKGAFGFNPVLLYGRDLDYLRVTAEEYADFLGAILPTWWRQREELSQVHPFDWLVGGFLKENTSLTCCDSGICARTHFSVLPDGTISHCGRASDWDLLDYGSILNTSLAEVFDDPQRAVLMQRNTVLPEGECKDCRFWEICHGGCPLDAWSWAGSFLHKSEWCMEKKLFIEKYLEPLLEREKKSGNGSNGAGACLPEKPEPAEIRTVERAVAGSDDGAVTWIDPYGGLGDALMLSGVLKQVNDRDPSRKFNLVDRTKYRAILEGHPAIACIGHPPAGAKLLRTDYWASHLFQVEHHRAYQVLAGLFGLETPVEERLYAPFELREDSLLTGAIPWKKLNVLISHSSASPRKEMSLQIWERLLELLDREGVLAVQATRLQDRYIRGAFSLLGLAGPRQVISMMKRFDAVITSDSFLMHAAHLCGIQALVLWGPTDHRTYGYPEQIHFQAKLACDYPAGCIGPEHPEFYASKCPQGAAHCMNSFSAETICAAVMDLLASNRAMRSGEDVWLLADLRDNAYKKF
ncbi:MAG: radical SAM protein [Candidatus Korobacteraceae bacterium]